MRTNKNLNPKSYAIIKGIRLPIDKDEWDAGRKWETLETRILTFLQNNPDKGFTANEIYESLGYRHGTDFLGFIGGLAMFGTIQHALDTLVKEGSVRAKIVKQEIGEDTYYRAKLASFGEM